MAGKEKEGGEELQEEHSRSDIGKRRAMAMPGATTRRAPHFRRFCNMPKHDRNPPHTLSKRERSEVRVGTCGCVYVGTISEEDDGEENVADGPSGNCVNAKGVGNKPMGRGDCRLFSTT